MSHGNVCPGFRERGGEQRNNLPLQFFYCFLLKIMFKVAYFVPRTVVSGPQHLPGMVSNSPYRASLSFKAEPGP